MNSIKPKSGCIICGAGLIYSENRRLMECAICHETKPADANCKSEHFICDSCHTDNPNTWIENQCLISTVTDPIKLAIKLMRHPCVAMHGPEHHFIVPAVLLTAYYNLERNEDKKKFKIKEARRRSETVAGGACGFHGACGAAIGAGIFTSLVLEATPLSIEEYRLCNSATAEALTRIAERGGPRCCKRNVFLAIECASEFSSSHLGQPIPAEKASCSFFRGNSECLGLECVFFDKTEMTERLHQADADKPR